MLCGASGAIKAETIIHHQPKEESTWSETFRKLIQIPVVYGRFWRGADRAGSGSQPLSSSDFVPLRESWLICVGVGLL